MIGSILIFLQRSSYFQPSSPWLIFAHCMQGQIYRRFTILNCESESRTATMFFALQAMPPSSECHPGTTCLYCCVATFVSDVQALLRASTPLVGPSLPETYMCKTILDDLLLQLPNIYYKLFSFVYWLQLLCIWRFGFRVQILCGSVVLNRIELKLCVCVSEVMSEWTL